MLPEPELCAVTVYQHNGPGPGQKQDVTVAGRKVKLDRSGLVPGTGQPIEFEFDAAFGPDAPASTASKDAIDSIVQSVRIGVNGLLLVLGQSRSGKTELTHGTGAAEASSSAGDSSGFCGVAEACVRALCALLPFGSSPDASAKLSMRFLNVSG